MKAFSRQVQYTFMLTCLLFPSVAYSGGAVAHLQPSAFVSQDGLRLLEKATNANGGKALRNLNTVRQQYELTFVDAKEQPLVVLSGEFSADYNNGWLQFTNYLGDQIILKEILTSQGSFKFTPQTGTVPLSSQEIQKLKEALLRGAPGLRMGSQGRESIKDLGMQSWVKVEGKDIKGTVLETVTKGVKATYLLNPQGLIIAESYSLSELGEIIVVYKGYKEVGGIPCVQKALAFTPGGTLLFIMKDLGTEFNIPLPADIFKVPE